jgi:glutamate carboxypeptidase
MDVARVPAARAGDHVRAGIGDGIRQVLLLGHFDTVWPVGQLQTMPLQRKDGRLHGPGIFDMKAGIGLATLAARALTVDGPLARARVVMLWTSDEETGSRSSRALIEDEARRSEAVLVFEPPLPGGGLKTSRKGVGQFEIVARGRAAHAGLEPEKGVSAIHELARQVLAVEALQDPGRGVTLTVGVVRGGTRPNVVPAEARALVDARAATRADAERVERRLRSLAPQTPGASLEVAGGFDRPPLERSAGVARLYDLARESAAELGLPIAEGSAGGGSDGNFTAALGVPTLDGLGAVGDGAHAVHEHVELDALAPRAALIAALLRRLIGPAYTAP